MEKDMPVIATASPDNATGKVAETYSNITSTIGFVPNAMKIYSSSPVLLENIWSQISFYMKHPTLSFPLLAAIRMLVSSKQDCEYCVGFNQAMLVNHAGWPQEQVSAAMKDPASAPFAEKDKALLLYVLDALAAPKKLEKARIDALHELGWSDSEILEAVHHAAQNVAEDMVFNTFRIERDY
jgi:uncharacterized peroxidase-related enzyme